MGCSCCKTIKFTDNSGYNDRINKFNEIFLPLDNRNSTIKIDLTECTLHNIGKTGFAQFCELNLEYIKILYLSNNEISNIECLQKCQFPFLEKLNLDCNNIINVDIFGKVQYPLEFLDLSYNMIKDISIFSKEETLPKLKKLLLCKNYFNSKDKKIKNILEKIKEKINKRENSKLEYSDDESYEKLIKRIHTINDKYIDETQDKIGIFDKNLGKSLNRIKTEKIINEEDEKEYDSLIHEVDQVKKSVKSPDDHLENNDENRKKSDSPKINDENQ